MYLMDGTQPIMISDAVNESDRLSSCSKRVRKTVNALQSPFHVYAFQTVNDPEMEWNSEDTLLKYNVNGIRMSEAAFHKLQQEISLQPCALDFPALKMQGECRLWSALVPVGNDVFRKIVVRASRVPLVEARTCALQHWTDQWYYEVCANPTVYSMLEGTTAAGT